MLELLPVENWLLERGWMPGAAPSYAYVRLRTCS